MFYPRRVIDINDGKPKWSGISEASELIADTPDEHKHKKQRKDAEQNEQKGNGDHD